MPKQKRSERDIVFEGYNNVNVRCGELARSLKAMEVQRDKHKPYDEEAYGLLLAEYAEMKEQQAMLRRRVNEFRKADAEAEQAARLEQETELKAKVDDAVETYQAACMAMVQAGIAAQSVIREHQTIVAEIQKYQASVGGTPRHYPIRTLPMVDLQTALRAANPLLAAQGQLGRPPEPPPNKRRPMQAESPATVMGQANYVAALTNGTVRLESSAAYDFGVELSEHERD
ncbi:MAG TPA: hypothetical protein PKE45_11670 [Caldilineaceae bacterium]|nr:hypothetical protein [Caldilineaceae bacterium]